MSDFGEKKKRMILKQYPFFGTFTTNTMFVRKPNSTIESCWWPTKCCKKIQLCETLYYTFLSVTTITLGFNFLENSIIDAKFVGSYVSWTGIIIIFEFKYLD